MSIPIYVIELYLFFLHGSFGYIIMMMVMGFEAYEQPHYMTRTKIYVGIGHGRNR